MNPVVVHVVRPYSSEQDYLSAEAWSIDAKSMLLIDAQALPVDTAVLFDVALSDGHKPIRAEGRVLSVVAAQGDRPAGLRVRFKRFGAATKAFIERAVEAKRWAGEPERASEVQLEPPSQVELERPSAPEFDRLSAPELRLSMTELESVAELESVTVAAPVPAPSTREPSGVRPRVAGPVAAPADREALLERLRRRRQAG